MSLFLSEHLLRSLLNFWGLNDRVNGFVEHYKGLMR